MREHYCTWKVVLAALTAVASYGDTQPFSTISVTNSPMLPAIQAGRPNGTYTLSGVESVNVYNGHVSIAIPILTVGGRGSSGYTMKALVSPAAWQADTEVDVDPNYNPSPVYFYHTLIRRESWNPYRAGYGQIGRAHV